MVRRLPSADEREVHRGHRGDGLQKWLTVVLKHKQGISCNNLMVCFVVCGKTCYTTGEVKPAMLYVLCYCGSYDFKKNMSV